VRIRPPESALRPVLAAALIGCLVGTPIAFVTVWQAAPLIGWDAGASVFLIWIWASIGGLDAKHTASAAAREDPSAPIADAVIIGAGVACLGAVGLVLIKAANSQGAAKALLIALGVASVAISWASVHTIFTLRYARAYYRARSPGGIDFNGDDPPDYLDFAYVSFTIGLTFQVSDTDLQSKSIRRLALRHALLSFLFGAVIVGLTINVVASLLH
jgi:uncharacterized membrane protein